MKKLILILLVISVIGVSLSGCSNKPNLKQWSKATAFYLLSKKNQSYKVVLIKCRSEKALGSNMGECIYNLVKAGQTHKYISYFMQSVNGKWHLGGLLNSTYHYAGNNF